MTQPCTSENNSSYFKFMFNKNCHRIKVLVCTKSHLFPYDVTVSKITYYYAGSIWFTACLIHICYHINVSEPKNLK